MAKDLIKLPNNKWGFLIVIVIMALIAAWALAATFHAIRTEQTRTVLYGAITLFAVFYILGRSIRALRDLLRRERAEKREERDE